MSESRPAPDASPPDRRSRLVRGGIVMTAVSVVNRFSSFIAQLFLGRLLLEEEFGLFAVALGLTSLGAALRSALQPVLISFLENDTDSFDRTYRTTMLSIWMITLGGVATSGWIEGVLDAPGLQRLLVVLLLIIPLQVLAGFATARVSHSLEFGSIAIANTVVPIARHASTVAFAFAGLGAMSLVLGAVIASVIELVALARYTTLFVSPGVLSARTLDDVVTAGRALLHRVDRRWVWLSALALALANNGDYTAASLWSTPEIIGLYYFAFALTAAFWLPLNLAVNTVLVPGFVGLRTEGERRERTLETVSTFAVIGVLVFNTVSVTIVPLTHLLWSGRWDAAIPALLGLSLLAPLQFLHPVVWAIERATGAWTLYLLGIVAYAVLTLAGAALGGWIGGLVPIVVLVVAAELIVTFGGLIALGARLGIPLRPLLGRATAPWALGAIAVVASHLVHPLDDPDLPGAVVRALVYAAITVVAVVLPYRQALIGIARSALGPRWPLIGRAAG